MLTEVSVVPVRIADLNSAVVQKIVALRQQGVAYRKIAAAVGLSHGSVMRVIEWQETGQRPKTWQPRLPKRPRKGQRALPDFKRIASLEAGGHTVKDAWLDYARSNSSAYSYAYFSTLYRVWLDDRQKQPSADMNGDVTIVPIPDYSADEDHHAELYWKRKADPRSQIHVLSGFDCSLTVKNGELVCYDTGTERSFPKVTHGLSAVIFLGSAGQITIDASNGAQRRASAFASSAGTVNCSVS
jgi:hypothetical protein